jgi:D-alanyl-D-alanine carboxypeptidase
MDQQLSLALQHQYDRWQKFAPCLGSNVAILDGEHGSWSAATGYQEIKTCAPMPAGASFYIYSITKTFVAARVLQLDIELDRPISAYLKGLGLEGSRLPEGVTVRRLLNHTAGVPSYTALPDYLTATRDSPGQPWSRDEVIRRCCGGKLDFPPGDGWHYSNTGYMLLAQLIETIAGVTLSTAIADGILTPLGLDRTYVAEAVDQGLVTPGYARQLDPEERMVDVMPIYHPGWCLTGLMVSTVGDVARCFEILMSGGLLNPEQLTAMTAPVSTGGGAGWFFQNPSYGLGLMIDPDWGHGGLFGHGGDGPGANTWAMHLPNFHGRKVTLVAFCNTTMGGHPLYLVKDLLRVLAAV